MPAAGIMFRRRPSLHLALKLRIVLGLYLWPNRAIIDPIKPHKEVQL